MKRLTLLTVLALFTMCRTAFADIINVEIDSPGTVALGGTLLLVSGSLECDVPPGSIFNDQSIFANLIQVSVGGKVFSQASGFSFLAQCGGMGIPIPFTFQMNVFGGSPFKPGRAAVTATANQFFCDVFFNCTSSTKTVSKTVNLTP